MSTLTENRHFHLILADIAMAAAIKTHDRGYVIAIGPEEYQPAAIRDAWLARNADESLRRRVTAMATAGVAALQGASPAQLTAAAETYGVPLVPGLAERIVEHFSDRRHAVLTYDR